MSRVRPGGSWRACSRGSAAEGGWGPVARGGLGACCSMLLGVGVRGWSAGGGDALEGRGGGGDDEQGDADGEPEGSGGAARHEGEAGGEQHADEGDSKMRQRVCRKIAEFSQSGKACLG
jgi:hypothetical protein